MKQIGITPFRSALEELLGQLEVLSSQPAADPHTTVPQVGWVRVTSIRFLFTGNGKPHLVVRASPG